MAKHIVNKTQIASDVSLAIVKAFRIANKRAGEFKRQYSDDESEEALSNYEAKCDELRRLAAKADERGFKIWVNFNGKTGHTYSKDYKPTPDADNDWETFNQAISTQDSMLNNLIFGESGLPNN